MASVGQLDDDGGWTIYQAERHTAFDTSKWGLCGRDLGEIPSAQHGESLPFCNVALSPVPMRRPIDEPARVSE